MPVPTDCRPTGKKRFDLSGKTACEQLLVLQQAYLELVTGNKSILVRFGERWLERGKGNVAALKQEVRELELKCADTADGAALGMKKRHALRAGPYGRPGASKRTYP